MRIYAEEQCNLEYLWAHHDIQEMFPSFKTLHKYHSKLCNQIHEIIRNITEQCTRHDSMFALPDILPGEQSVHNRLQQLFHLLDLLIEILHRKGYSDLILDEEKYAFLNYYLNQKAGIILLDSS